MSNGIYVFSLMNDETLAVMEKHFRMRGGGYERALTEAVRQAVLKGCREDLSVDDRISGYHAVANDLPVPLVILVTMGENHQRFGKALFIEQELKAIIYTWTGLSTTQVNVTMVEAPEPEAAGSPRAAPGATTPD